jgi:glucose-1-phosphate adenylyltransferase
MKLKHGTLAMILAGGRVDELNVLTYYRPKSAVPFGGLYRIIDFSLSNLMNSGLERAAILSQYRNFSLINHIGSGSAWDMVGRNRGISILPPFKGSEKSSWYRGSADAVAQNLDFVQYHRPEVILLLSGDHVYHMDYRRIIDYHRDRDADLTIGFVQIAPGKGHRFGVASLDDEDGPLGGRVLDYLEKPAKTEYKWASMTIFCFRPEVLYQELAREVAGRETFEFGRDIIPRMVAEGRRVYGYKFSDYWGYTRTVDEYWQTSMDLLGEAPAIRLEEWGLRTNLEHRALRDYQPLRVGDGAEISDSLIYNGCVIEGRVERSILFPGVRVGPGATVRDSIVFFDSRVAAGAELTKVICDVNVVFETACRVGRRPGEAGGAVTVVGWSNVIPPGADIGSGCTLYPHLDSQRLAGVTASGEEVK